MSKPINIGIIGCGGISGAHFGGYKQAENVRILAVCDVDRARAEARSKEFAPEARIYSDPKALLASEDIDGVSVCTPTQWHAELSIAALDAGKHVLCEKPMASNLAEARRMIEAADKAGKTLLIDHRYLYDPIISAIRSHLQAIGEVFWCRTRSAHFGNVADHIAKTGALIDIGYHPLYTALYFLGPARKVTAWRRSFVRREMRDDNGLMVVEHERGLSIVEGSFSSHGPFGSTRPIELYGSKGVLLGNWIPKPLLTLTVGNEMNPVEVVPGDPWHVGLVKHFCACVRGEARPLSDGRAGLQVMQVIEAIEKGTDGMVSSVL